MRSGARATRRRRPSKSATTMSWPKLRHVSGTRARASTTRRSTSAVERLTPCTAMPPAPIRAPRICAPSSAPTTAARTLIRSVPACSARSAALPAADDPAFGGLRAETTPRTRRTRRDLDRPARKPREPSQRRSCAALDRRPHVVSRRLRIAWLTAILQWPGYWEACPWLDAVTASPRSSGGAPGRTRTGCG